MAGHWGYIDGGYYDVDDSDSCTCGHAAIRHTPVGVEEDCHGLGHGVYGAALCGCKGFKLDEEGWEGPYGKGL